MTPNGGTRPRIVVAGGGAGGLELAVALARAVRHRRLHATITLIDSEQGHFWKPRLHEVAVGLIDPAQQSIPYADLARQRGFRFIQARVTGLEAETALLLDPAPPEPFDLLILALGSTINSFATQGVTEYCDMLDSVAQALTLNTRLLDSARAQSSSHAHPPAIAIVGAGATGVELAAELRYAARQRPEYGALADPKNLPITIIDLADRILPSLAPDISRDTARRLHASGIAVALGQRVVRVTETAVECADGTRIDATIKVWASGVKGLDILADLPQFTHSRDGRIETDSTLLCHGCSRIYAIGDCAAFAHDGKPLAPTAQAAHQQAEYLAKTLPRLLRGHPVKPFRYSDRGTIVSLGEHRAIGQMGAALRLRGATAKLVYVWLYAAHLAAVYGWPTATRMMFANTAIGRIPLKLHNLAPDR